MIRGIGVERTSTYSQTLNRRVGGSFPTGRTAKNAGALCGAVFGKQNRRCGMNRTSGYGARVDAEQKPGKVLVDPDSRTVAMEVGTR